jgi:hypothetical protein
LSGGIEIENSGVVVGVRRVRVGVVGVVVVVGAGVGVGVGVNIWLGGRGWGVRLGWGNCDLGWKNASWCS